jgi:hypothetical protein
MASRGLHKIFSLPYYPNGLSIWNFCMAGLLMSETFSHRILLSWYIMYHRIFNNKVLFNDSSTKQNRHYKHI